MPAESQDVLLPPECLSVDAQAAIRANMNGYAAFARRVDALNLSQEQLKAISSLSNEQWNKISDRLHASPGFQARAGADGESLEVQGTNDDEVAYIAGIIGAANATLGVAAAIAGIAAAAFATGVGFVVGIIAAVIGAVVAIVGAVMTLIALLQPIESTLERGGHGGALFNDTVKEGWQIKKIVVRHGAWVDGIQCVWRRPDGRLEVGALHGGCGGQETVITLDDDERVTEVNAYVGTFVDALEFRTSKDRRLGPYGGSGGKVFSLKPTVGYVRGFYGRSGNLLDAIGIQDDLFTYERKYCGGTGGVPFIDDVSQMRDLKRITVYSGAWIDGINFTWTDNEGKEQAGEEHGRYALKGGERHTIDLEPGEKLTRITGQADVYVDRIQFHTNLRTYGPFGGTGGKPFEIDLANRQVLCFIGRWGVYIDGFGVLAKQAA